MSTYKNRDITLEILRIISAFFVIFNHIGGYKLFETTEYGTFRFWMYLFVSVFCKSAVPLFFMISGALLLEKKESVCVVLKKRVSKILITLIVISICYYLRNFVYHIKPVSIYDFFGCFFSSNIASHLWFLYSYIAFLLLLPFLRILIEKMTNQYFIYYFCLSGIFMCVIPIVQYLIFQDKYEIFNGFNVFSIEVLIYPTIGYFIYNKIDFKIIKNRHVVFMWIINLTTLCFSCFITYLILMNKENQDIYTERFFHTFSFVNAATLFVTFKKYFNTTRNKIVNRLIYSAGEATFGIYLIHILAFDVGLLYYPSNLILHTGMPMLSNFVLVFVVFVFCWIVIFVLKKIPVIKKYI